MNTTELLKGTLSTIILKVLAEGKGAVEGEDPDQRRLPLPCTSKGRKMSSSNADFQENSPF